MQNFELLQWNIHGYMNNYDHLKLLIKQRNPAFICLQETHNKYNYNPFPPKRYLKYFVNSPLNDTSKQGVGIPIKNNIPSTQTNIYQHITASYSNRNKN